MSTRNVVLVDHVRAGPGRAAGQVRQVGQLAQNGLVRLGRIGAWDRSTPVAAPADCCSVTAATWLRGTAVWQHRPARTRNALRRPTWPGSCAARGRGGPRVGSVLLERLPRLTWMSGERSLPAGHRRDLGRRRAESRSCRAVPARWCRRARAAGVAPRDERVPWPSSGRTRRRWPAGSAPRRPVAVLEDAVAGARRRPPVDPVAFAVAGGGASRGWAGVVAELARRAGLSSRNCTAARDASATGRRRWTGSCGCSASCSWAGSTRGRTGPAGRRRWLRGRGRPRPTTAAPLAGATSGKLIARNGTGGAPADELIAQAWHRRLRPPAGELIAQARHRQLRLAGRRADRLGTAGPAAARQGRRPGSTASDGIDELVGRVDHADDDEVVRLTAAGAGLGRPATRGGHGRRNGGRAEDGVAAEKTTAPAATPRTGCPAAPRPRRRRPWRARHGTAWPATGRGTIDSAGGGPVAHTGGTRSPHRRPAARGRRLPCRPPAHREHVPRVAPAGPAPARAAARRCSRTRRRAGPPGPRSRRRPAAPAARRAPGAGSRGCHRPRRSTRRASRACPPRSARGGRLGPHVRLGGVAEREDRPVELLVRQDRQHGRTGPCPGRPSAAGGRRRAGRGAR